MNYELIVKEVEEFLRKNKSMNQEDYDRILIEAGEETEFNKGAVIK